MAATLEPDPLAGDPRVAAYFGPAWPKVERFHELLCRQGVLRGLIGPREVSRLWERHLLNSASIVPFLPTTGSVVDVGSGAGLPGVVIAAMLPDLDVVLLEPMERRTDWLTEVVDELGLDRVRVLRGRAQDVHLQVDAVTSRAVASLDKLYAWTMPLLRPDGLLVALKGARVQDEVDAARAVAARTGASRVEVLDAPTIDGVEPTRVVRATREVRTGVR